MNAALLGFLLLPLAFLLLLSQSSACPQIHDPDLVAVILLAAKAEAEIGAATCGGDDGLRCQLPFALGDWKIRQGLVKRPWQLRPTCAA